ncbi:MAG: alkaline phosphatase D [Hyphomicrobiaceae bacterium]|jgi:alkaline phosphatase D
MNCFSTAARTALLATALLATSVLVTPLASQESQLKQGPLIGHTDSSSVHVWARASVAGDYVLKAQGIAATKMLLEATATAKPENDLCMVFELKGLGANASYRYRIETAAGELVCGGDDYVLRTAATNDANGNVRVMFGSCCYEDEGTGDTWQRVAVEKPDVVVLLGDTPYINNTQIKQQRRRYAEFAGFAPMANLLRTTSWYGTWDDHDFGDNDTDGRMRGKANSRQAFLEYHANPSYGDGQNGIYTKFRRGPVEVFVLDTRTFAATEPSPFLRHHASLLGSKQWKWLLKGLTESTAPVKVLACGMIWNEATRPNKQDHWGSYPHERSALFKEIGRNKITGVVLVGGDIHRSRVVRHATKETAGYDIIELISSPMHHSIIKKANAPHPGLIKDMGEPHTFLLIDAKQLDGKLSSVRARFVNDEGTEHFAIDLLK